MNQIHESFRQGENFKIGVFNHIHEGVVVGDNTTIMSFTEIRGGTIVGDDCYIDSGVSFSGENRIGNRVTIRYKSILARGVIIEDDVFISPQVMFVKIPFKEEGKDSHTIVKEGAKIGTGAIIMPGIIIGRGVIIGAGAIVTKDCLEEGKTYRASSGMVAKRR